MVVTIQNHQRLMYISLRELQAASLEMAANLQKIAALHKVTSSISMLKDRAVTLEVTVEESNGDIHHLFSIPLRPNPDLNNE